MTPFTKQPHLESTGVWWSAFAILIVGPSTFSMTALVSYYLSLVTVKNFAHNPTLHSFTFQHVKANRQLVCHPGTGLRMNAWHGCHTTKTFHVHLAFSWAQVVNTVYRLHLGKACTCLVGFRAPTASDSLPKERPLSVVLKVMLQNLPSDAPWYGKITT